jgi:hypothetical protein
MTDILKKNNNNVNLIEDYLIAITNKCESQITICKDKKIKNNNEKTTIPNIDSYNDLYRINYNLTQLRAFAKHYKLKMSGNKNELLSRVHNYLYFSSYIIKIQKVFRMFLVNKYKKLHGPASLNRKLCTNTNDFITLELVEEINFHQFFSYKDQDGFIYGFDINSLHNSLLKTGPKNPYNRNLFSDDIFENIRNLIRISKLLKIDIDLIFEDGTKNLSNEKAIELRTLAVFQNIDLLGNYSNANWFLSLNRSQLIKFIRELIDIWNYRAQLQNEIKRNICPPFGDPFKNIHFGYVNTEENLWNVKKVILEVIEKLVNSGIDRDSKSLGAYYVLGCLTLVNIDASTSLPWLFQSFTYF